MARILVLGSLNMDLVVTVPHLPRPGETVLGERLGRYPGGKGANGRLDKFDIERAVAKLQSGDVLVTQLEIPMDVIMQAAQAARRAGAHVVLNAAPAQRLDAGLLNQVEALVVNEREASALVNETSPEAMVQALHAIGPRIAIVTLGPSGSVYCDETGVHRVEP